MEAIAELPCEWTMTGSDSNALLCVCSDLQPDEIRGVCNCVCMAMSYMLLTKQCSDKVVDVYLAKKAVHRRR